jgi:hypothetical protein
MSSIRRAFVAVVVALLVATAGSAYADHAVTLVLRSGEQLSGHFTDLHQDLVYLRVDNRNQERRVPLADIAVMDFTGGVTSDRDDDAALRRNRGGGAEHLLVLRNGRRVEGRFEGLTGDDQPHREGHALEFVFSTSSGEYVRVNADRIARIYLADPRDVVNTTTDGDVTVWMDDGSSMRGSLTALDARAFALDSMRSGGVASRRALQDVSVIDFEGSGPRTEERAWDSRDTRAPHLLVMRDGRRLTGEFIGPARRASGRGASYLFRSTNGRIATFTPATASRLYLGHGASGMTSGGDTDFNSRETIVVTAREGWTATGLDVRRGDLIAFRARGEVQLSTDNNDRARPGGSVSNRQAAQAPVRNAPAGALIGRVGGTAFLIGDGEQGIRMPASGELFLGVNDDHFPDNQGTYEVIVRRARVGSE